MNTFALFLCVSLVLIYCTVDVASAPTKPPNSDESNSESAEDTEERLLRAEHVKNSTPHDQLPLNSLDPRASPSNEVLNDAWDYAKTHVNENNCKYLKYFPRLYIVKFCNKVICCCSRQLIFEVSLYGWINAIWISLGVTQ